MALQPFHYHLHHFNDTIFNNAAVMHDHEIDLHFLTDARGQHHHDDDTTIIAASPDGIIKNSQPDYLPLILLAIALLLPAVLTSSLLVPVELHNKRPQRHKYHFSPQLRAPPLL